MLNVPPSASSSQRSVASKRCSNRSLCGDSVGLSFKRSGVASAQPIAEWLSAGTRRALATASERRVRSSRVLAVCHGAGAFAATGAVDSASAPARQRPVRERRDGRHDVRCRRGRAAASMVRCCRPIEPGHSQRAKQESATGASHRLLRPGLAAELAVLYRRADVLGGDVVRVFGERGEQGLVRDDIDAARQPAGGAASCSG